MTDIFSEDKGGGKAESRKRPSSGMIKRRNEMYYMHREREGPLKETVTKSFGRIPIYLEIPVDTPISINRITILLSMRRYLKDHARGAKFEILMMSFLKIIEILDFEPFVGRNVAPTVTAG